MLKSLGPKFLFVVSRGALVLALSVLPVSWAAADSCFPSNAATEPELDAAISCYNSETAPGTYTLTLTADIPLTTSTPNINNTNAGVKLLIAGNGHKVDGQNSAGVRPFRIVGSATVVIQDLTVANGNPIGDGGAIDNEGGTLTVKDCTFSGNRAAVTSATSQFIQGGAIFVINGTLTVTDCTFAGNSASITTQSFIASASGGAIANYANSTLTVTNSTFFGNSANASTSGDGAQAEAAGGGIYNGDTMTLRNCTFSGNGATATTTGANSSASSAGGGIFNGNGAVLNLFNTIIANSTNGDCDNETLTLTESHNLIQDGSHACGLSNGTNGDIVGLAAELGSLADNGGKTQTMALLTGSPAIDNGSDAVCSAPPVSSLDQRGVTRPQGAHCDVGAYEAFPSVLAIPALSPIGLTLLGFLLAIGALVLLRR